MSKTQVDRLGDRLRAGTSSENDLRELSAYRQSFAPAYQEVVELIRVRLGFVPTGRPAKSTTAIVEKLRRESIRLSQIQDIAGARIVVSNVRYQDTVVEQLGNLFQRVSRIDRREKPSHGYRAVHVIPHIGNTPVEIQVRTALQHHWAELSEKLSDLIDPSIKYGGGAAEMHDALLSASGMIARIEALQKNIARMAVNIANPTIETQLKLDELRLEIQSIEVQAHEELDQLFVKIRILAGGS